MMSYTCFGVLLVWLLISKGNCSPIVKTDNVPLRPMRAPSYPAGNQSSNAQLPLKKLSSLPYNSLISLSNVFSKLRKANHSALEGLNLTAIQEEIDHQLTIYNHTGREGRSWDVPRLPRFLSSALKYLDLNRVVHEIENSLLSSVTCSACKAGVSLLQHYIATGKRPQEIAEAAIKLCISLRLQTSRVCIGVINLMADEVIYIVDRLALRPAELCGIIVGDSCSIPYNPYDNWSVALPPYPKPPIKPIKPPEPGRPMKKVLQVSDTHFDPYYAPGSNADCGEPLCCRATSGKPKDKASKAGLWGDYRKCDTPLRTLNSMIEHIAQTHKDIDYIIWTGDLPPHDIWNQTHDENINILRQTASQMAYYFPNVPIFPAMGNHESVPVNSFPPPYVDPQFSIDWLYDEVDAQWRRWLPEATSKTVRKGAFYSVEVSPGFRIISINMNYCHNKNWWLLLNTTDPLQELEWLTYELQAAELRGEKVHILGHIPPGHQDCLKSWSANYYNIVNRYESTIAAQFFGHTHYDEFELFYDTTYGNHKNHRVTNIAYVGPSVTPYYDLNPGYRIYLIDGDYAGSTRMVVDHATWILDLEQANKHRVAKWKPLYSAKKAYKLNSLVPNDWDRLVQNMMHNDQLFNMYYKFYWKASSKRPDCDEDCKKRLLCDLVSGRSNDRAATCDILHQQIEAQNRQDWTSFFFNSVTLTYDTFMTYRMFI